MAYSELVSFIKEQLGAGRDAKTIRDYLLRRNMDPRAVDAAFDEVFGSKQEEPKGHAEKIVLVGMIVLVLAFIGIGFSFYNQIVPTNPPIDDNYIIPIEPVDNLQEVSVCDFEDDEEKYDCYISKFETDEVKCYEIDDESEKEFCYIARDMYALSA